MWKQTVKMFVVEVNLAFSFYVEPTVSVSSVSIVITRVPNRFNFRV